MFKILLISFLACLFYQDEPTMSWNPNKKLNWTNFQATPKPHHEVIAVTASGLSFHYSTTRYNTGRIDYDFEVIAHFYPEKSWYIKDDVTEITLAHERLHFDITELHARKFRQRVKDTKFSTNIDAEMDAINIAINTELRDMQKQYDLDTSHSRIVEKQVVWQSFIAEALDNLANYQE